MKKGKLLLGLAVLGAVILAKRKKAALGFPPGVKFYGNLPGQFGPPQTPVIVYTTELLPSPCEAPWLFTKPEEACRNYLDDKRRAERVRSITSAFQGRIIR